MLPIHPLRTELPKKFKIISTDPCNSEDTFHAREQKIEGSCYHNLVKSDSKARPKEETELSEYSCDKPQDKLSHRIYVN